jgi:hypothetical protein
MPLLNGRLNALLAGRAAVTAPRNGFSFAGISRCERHFAQNAPAFFALWYQSFVRCI